MVCPDAIVRAREFELHAAADPNSKFALLPPDTAEMATVEPATAPAKPEMVIPELFEAGVSRLTMSVTVSVLLPPARGWLCPMLAVVKRISKSQFPTAVDPALDQ